LQALVTRKSKVSAELSRCAAGKFMGAGSIAEHTVIELTGTERPGLLSEIFAVLTEMNCRVHASEFWTHNRRVACMVYITDEDTSGPIHNVKKLVAIKEKLHLVMQGDNDETRVARTNVAEGATHTERRLHQLMLADKDYEDSEQLERSKPVAAKDKPTITVQTSRERGYSVINVRCIDRPKLLFDTVCTLTDMQYVVFHATATLEPASGPWAVQVEKSSLLPLFPL
jgi:UTP:GlnB (protein PII) uridylyltransferase